MAVVIVAAWSLGRAPSLALLGAMLVAAAGLIVLRYRSLALPGLLLATAFIPFTLGTGTDSAINITMLGVAGLGAIWIVEMLLQRDVRLPKSESNWAWIALLASAVVSVIASAAQWNPFVLVKSNFFLVQMAQLSIYILSALAFLFTAHFARTRKDLRVLVGLIFVFGLLVALGRFVPGLRIVNSWLLLQSVNVRVCFTGFAMAMAIYDDTLGMRSRIALAAAAIVGGIVLPMTQAGGWASGWVPGLIAAVTVILLRLGSKSIRLAIAIIPLVPIAFFALFRRLLESESWSFNTRMIAWRGLFDLVGDQWLFGLGLAGYWHYWRAVIGSFSYFDPLTGYMHFTDDPKVNMHNNFLDIYGQMGVVGTLAFAWLLIALLLTAFRVYRAEPGGFGKAYAAAAFSVIVAMSAASMLGDWLFPFVYNIGLLGFRDSSVTWVLLGGLLVLDATRGSHLNGQRTTTG